MTHVKCAGLVAVLVAICGAWQASAYGQAAAPAAELPDEIRDPDAKAAYKQGVDLLTEEKYKEAVTAFNRALQIDGTYDDAYIGKGDAFKGAEDYSSAAVAYSRAIELDPNSAAAYNGRGESQLELRQIDLAVTDFRAALDLDPNNPTILSNYGHVLVNNLGDSVGGIQRLTDALALNDQDARAYRDRGLAHAQLREFEESVADMQRAVDVEQENYENYQMLATIHLFQDQYQPAIDAITKAIDAYKPKKSSEPEKFVDGYLMRADAQARMAEQATDPAQRDAAFAAAIADSDAVLAMYEDRYPHSGIAFYRRGRAQRMLGQYSDAVDSLTRAIQLVPGDAEQSYLTDAYLYRGICWYYIGSNDLARGDFEQASATGGGFGDPRVFLWIGFTHHKEGDYRQAIDSYSEAIAKSPTFALAHVNRGRAYIDLKEYSRAIESFNNAIRAEPGVGEHYYNVGFAYMQLEDYQKAVDFLNLAVHKEDATPKMFRMMAAALRELGRNELAEEYDRKAESAPSPATGG